MARERSKNKIDRRSFLTGVAVAGAAGTATTIMPQAAAAAPSILNEQTPRPSALPPTAKMAAAEAGTPQEIKHESGKPGSDFMVDVIKTLDIKYMPCNPASSFRALHESLIDYGGNKSPEFLTCMHEESAVGMAHGYFKIAGKPLMTLVHGTVGLQHAAMAVYNAWCDRVPVIVVGGNDMDAAHRPPGVPTFHSAQDINALVRDFTKWDDTPVSAQHFAQSFVRMYKIATTPPYGPVMMSLDAGLQQEPIRDHGEKLYIPRFVPSSPPQGDSGAVKEAARLLANAERPVIVVDRAARTPNGIKLLVELAEALQAPVVDQGGRIELPENALSQSAPERDRPGRRHHRHGAVRFLGRGEWLHRQRCPWHRRQPVQDQARHQADQHQLGRAHHQVELPGLPAFPGGRRVDARRRRGNAAGADRSGEGRHPQRPQGGDRQARRGDPQGAHRRASECAARRGACLGCLAHQHRPPGDGDLGADQGSRLVAGRLRGQCQLLAEPAMADGKASPLAGPLRRLRRRLRRAGLDRRGAGQPRSRPLLRVDPVRRRPDVCAGRAVDRGAAQDSAAGGHAQQPRLSSGSDACAALGEFPRPRRQCR